MCSIRELFFLTEKESCKNFTYNERIVAKTYEFEGESYTSDPPFYNQTSSYQRSSEFHRWLTLSVS